MFPSSQNVSDWEPAPHQWGVLDQLAVKCYKFRNGVPPSKWIGQRKQEVHSLHLQNLKYRHKQ